MKILVAIANYGTKQDHYLQRLLAEYRSMAFDVHVVVLSNLEKDLGRDVELRVGLPTKNPWSLPYSHKQLFADRIEDYDLFIYSEDDMLVSEQNIRAFLNACKLLRDDEIPGFLRTERDSDTSEYFCDAFEQWHWDPASVVTRNGQTFAFFSNEHSACYMLSREQLRRCIKSGGFLVQPHEDRYDLLCAAATDPYARCGFRKLICVSDLDNFLLPHLSNKYIAKCSLPGPDFRRQVAALLQINEGGRPTTQLFKTETRLPEIRWSKSYYEPARIEVLELIRKNAGSVLSVGCGWGASEELLQSRGIHVVALPLDSVIASCAEARGIEVIHGTMDEAQEKLVGRQFDYILFSNVLHIYPDPCRLLESFKKNLSRDGKIITTVPNLWKPRVVWGRLRREKRYAGIGDYAQGGVHSVSSRRLHKWLQQAGYKVERAMPVLPEKTPKWAQEVRLGNVDLLIASEIIAVAS
jgi:2-polyprenyl-3-methyl-5-hydroxy-6-metoxy-1,4-benzoquinol methylase